ncbi:MFS transporter [Pseudohyphozyma bogoriensis]|nr:MFS transporter [Pseudohyphozyma bogoriensis]
MSHTDLEKHEVNMVEEVALDGHAATDDKGHALLQRDEAAEAKLRWKMDLHIMPKDLKLVGYQYNILLSAFYVAYAVFEIPAMLLCKKMGPSRFIPLSTVAFGLFAMVTGFIHTARVAVRFLLGISEGAVFPGMAYYLTRWYRKEELAFRLSLYVVSAPLAGAFGGLLASGILKLHGFGIVHTWRQIFVIEGIITMGLGVLAFFVMSEGPASARWLTEEEKALAAARIKSENVGSTVVVDKMSNKAVLDGMFSPTTIVTALIFMLDNITVQGLGFFLPTVIRTIYPRSTTIQQQLRTVPPYVVGAFFTLLVPFLSWKTNRRLLFMTISAPMIVIGYAIFVGTDDPHVRYGATFITGIGAFSFGALCNALVSVNCTSDSMRNGAIGVNVMAGNLGGLVATWTFLPSDAPNYKRGNSTNLGTGSAIFVLCVGLWCWHIYQNKRKDAGKDDHMLEGKTPAEIEHLGRHHPGFRYLN